MFAIFRVIAIHEKLSNLAQIAELSLPSVPEVASNENIYESVEPEEKSIDTDMEVSRLLSDSRMNLPLWERGQTMHCPSRFRHITRTNILLV